MVSEVNFEKLFNPCSIAFIGEGTAWSGACRRAWERLRTFNGTLFEVKNERDLPSGVDLAVLDVPPLRSSHWFHLCADRNVPFVLQLASEQSGEWRLPRKEIFTVKQPKALFRVLGPDSMGFINQRDHIVISPFQGYLEQGENLRVALVSQSGDLGFSIASAACQAGTGFKYVVTTGGTSDVNVVEIGEWILRDPNIKLLLFCLEGLQDGIAFLRLAREANRRKVRVGVLKAGRNVSSRQAIPSHVAALPGNAAIWDAAFKQFGIFSIRDTDEIINFAAMYNSFDSPPGRKTAIVSSSRGAGIALSDCCFEEGLKVPAVPEDLQRELRKKLPPSVYVNNPIDIASLGANGTEEISYLLRRLMDSPNLDMIAAVLTESYGQETKNILRALLGVARLQKHPVVCCAMGGLEEESREMLREEKIPFFLSTRRCAKALSALSAPFMQFDAHMPVSCEDCSVIKGEEALLSLPEKMTEYDAKRLLAFHGVDVTREYLCQSLDEALEAAEIIGYPVALKVMSPNIVHKSEARIIALNLEGEEELRNAYGRTLEKARLANPEAEIRGVLVQEMLQEGIECVVTIKLDTLFGPVLSVGLGGVYASAVRDYVLRIAPVDEVNAMAMIRELKGYSLLRGAWGRTSYDVGALAQMLTKLSRIACTESQLIQLEINPVFVNKKGAVVVDAFVLRR
ncbi:MULTISPECIES: acetate--CoA ligase family protein [Aminobacterium]|jgi:acyl-CoA synthetase (NDP forming)|uniref:acetate--CoA ligase family protein n=1 Tax=Aminobacterium TaxID=81466 RepID=UPI00046320F7|nr:MULTISPECIES: acetate--CoA ligase family protein [Aminobacterium]